MLDGLLRRLRRKSITRGDKLGILIGSIGLFYAIIAFFFGVSPPALVVPFGIITLVIGIVFAFSIYWVPLQVRMKGIKFSAEILDFKQSYRRGEEVRFYTYYRGELIHGFFDNEIFPPRGKEFGKSILIGRSGTAWSWAPNTLADDGFNTPGKLNGFVSHEEKWNWRIPMDAPTGEYTVYMRVYNHLGTGQRSLIEQKQASFDISD